MRANFCEIQRVKTNPVPCTANFIGVVLRNEQNAMQAASNRRWLWSFILSVLTLSLSIEHAEAKNHEDEIVFDEPFIDRAIVAAELSLMASTDDEDPINDGDYMFFETMQSVGNRAIVAQRDGVCYAAYGSVDPNRFQQLMQRIIALFTLDFDNFTKLCFDDDCCKVRTPVERQFDTLHADVEPLVENCRASCGETTPCPLILTGHHHGRYMFHVTDNHSHFFCFIRCNTIGGAGKYLETTTNKIHILTVASQSHIPQGFSSRMQIP